MPPHYGIVDGIAFYVAAAVVGNNKLAVRACGARKPLRQLGSKSAQVVANPVSGFDGLSTCSCGGVDMLD